MSNVATGEGVSEWPKPALISGNKVEITQECKCTVLGSGANLVDTVELTAEAGKWLTGEKVDYAEVGGGGGGGKVEGCNATRLEDGETNCSEASGKRATEGKDNTASGGGEQGTVEMKAREGTTQRVEVRGTSVTFEKTENVNVIKQGPDTAKSGGASAHRNVAGGKEGSGVPTSKSIEIM